MCTPAAVKLIIHYRYCCAFSGDNSEESKEDNATQEENTCKFPSDVSLYGASVPSRSFGSDW